MKSLLIDCFVLLFALGVSCGDEAQEHCALAFGTYEMTYTVHSTTCEDPPELNVPTPMESWEIGPVDAEILGNGAAELQCSPPTIFKEWDAMDAGFGWECYYAFKDTWVIEAEALEVQRFVLTTCVNYLGGVDSCETSLTLNGTLSSP